MAAVPENQRVAELQRLGVSDALVRLSRGEAIHEAFRHNCLGPPYYVYHSAGTPEGPPLVALWDRQDTVIGLWRRPDGLEFVEFSIEVDDEFTSLARTEQGFWATQIDLLYECEKPLEELEEAAAAVGFRFLERHMKARRANESMLGTFETHRTWLRRLVASIDHESGGPPQV